MLAVWGYYNLDLAWVWLLRIERVCRESHQPAWPGGECGYVNVNRGSHRISREARIPDRYPDQNTIHQWESGITHWTFHTETRRIVLTLMRLMMALIMIMDPRDGVTASVWTPDHHYPLSLLTASPRLICKVSKSVEEIFISSELQLIDCFIT